MKNSLDLLGANSSWFDGWGGGGRARPSRAARERMWERNGKIRRAMQVRESFTDEDLAREEEELVQQARELAVAKGLSTDYIGVGWKKND